MKRDNIKYVQIVAFWIITLAMVPAAIGAEKYMVNWEEYQKQKTILDDPRPVLKTYWTKQLTPPEVYAKYSYDIPTMKANWAEAVGFKAPDVVGKIAPEIKPGKYTHQDKQKYPGLKELMFPFFYENFFKPGAVPLGACVSEFEVVPTQQRYWPLPFSKATSQNMGKAKQDAQGYFDADTYISGMPFPRPSGSERIKAMQIVYNKIYTPLLWDASVGITDTQNYDRNFKNIYGGYGVSYSLQLSGRLKDAPTPFYDERAKKRNEFYLGAGTSMGSRDMYGSVSLSVAKIGIDPTDVYMYSGAIRRIRKMTGTDTQDTAAGQNVIFDDAGGFRRVLSPTLFPYEYKILADREYLVPWYTTDGKEYIQRSNLEIKNVRMERRPIYEIELIQQDTSYVYGKTLLYFDKETFFLYASMNYDQKGRLFRGQMFYPFQDPEMGLIGGFMSTNWNFQTPQTGYMASGPPLPAPWLTRDDFSFSNIEKMGK
ncbi:MAG: DUF1329 domain-containing protein [Desulfatitalea sp.]|nr:DUF1329 domain-containing protein [Desulfatitalea sp.]NNJ99639.1 DUF1329 domain-containing protein [Desulfatitalea sp.]